MVNKTTTSQLLVKLPQYVEETTEGTIPTASPSFTSCGAVESLSLNIDGQFVDVDQLAEDIISIIAGLNKYEIKLKYYLVTGATSTAFSKYAVNAANYATPAGLISATLSILWSIPLNGTENYIIAKGCRAKDWSVNMEVGKPIECNVTFECMTIAAPTASHGLTTPTFATNATGPVTSYLSGGTTPISYNASGLNCKKFSASISRNTSPDYTLGSQDPYGTQPHGRRISGDFQTLWTATTLEADVHTPTARTIVATLDSSNSKTLTFTSSNIVTYKRDNSGGDTNAVVEDTTFRCLSVALT